MAGLLGTGDLKNRARFILSLDRPVMGAVPDCISMIEVLWRQVLSFLAMTADKKEKS